jgi:PST family polysaccharide transporter
MRTPFLWLYVGKSGPLQARHVLYGAAPFVLGAHLALAAVWFAKPLLPAQPVIALAAGAVLAYVITIAVSLVFGAGREALREAMKLIPARGFAPAPSEAK